ncbi:MAG: NADPH-dependent assimilatory sulfite reductase hemoprotein subunit [Proteobacteria bacterium]|nr:NADPH-dependent assimilatory sulfite reductase hemoprotein subunit [Pseudomonadota bacterium]
MADLARNETIKARSDFLRGTLADELDVQAFGGLGEDDGQLIKFHGVYVQDDRDLRPERAKRKLDLAYMFMARLRVPGGVLTPRQYLAMDRLATERGNATVRLTTRQTIQFHGVIKGNVREAMRAMDAALLDTIAACGDVNRNVMAAANPYLSRAHGEAVEAARQLSAHFLPRTGAWREIFIGDERVLGGEPEAEPIYGPTYLPRKFKMTVAVPPSNDVDVFAHDLSFIAIVEGETIVGYNVVAGGGMGASHGDAATYPRVGDVIGYCAAADLIPVAEAVVTVQRDYGDRTNRKHARLKYTIDTHGLDWFKREVNARLATPLAPARPFEFTGNGDALGWLTDHEGLHHLTLFIENGRIADVGAWRLKSALVAINSMPDFIDRGAIIMTANQNIIIARASDADRAAIERILAEHGVVQHVSVLREGAMACVALPTCGLALAESERYLPHLITAIDGLLTENHLSDQRITVRMTGCPNGCARPYIAEIGLVGRNPGRYNLLLGGAADGSRLNTIYRENADEAEIIAALSPLFTQFAKDRLPGEGFGDYTRRAGIV